MRLLALSLLTAVGLTAQDPAVRVVAKLGHSHLGESFDVGPREKPWVMPGVGQAHFPITTSQPEVQKWFDQGNALLHSFWFYEAERSFRWCVKLEPDNAMAYWGLARAAQDLKRAADLIREAVKRKDKVSERERLYIEAWEVALVPDATGAKTDEQRDHEHRLLLQKICLRYPDDLEAKTLLALSSLDDAHALSNDVLLKSVLAKQADHPGAHHYRIHNWNSAGAEQALDSSARYGQIASGIGHALHMPGHIYSTVGMWNEAALSMDTATRVEKSYMRDRLIFPFNNWNYGHNRNYLAYIQEQLGMAEEAISGARQLIAAPLDPQLNGDDSRSTHTQGMTSLIRTLVKYERWNDLLNPDMFPWRDLPQDKVNKAYTRARAFLGLGDLANAEKEIRKLDEVRVGESAKSFEPTSSIMATELKGRLALAKGNSIQGLAWLAEAAEKERLLQREQNDPPFYPEVLYNALGQAYLSEKSPSLAVKAFDRALEITRNDGFALSGLVQAHHALGNAPQAKDAMARLLYVMADADRGLQVLERAKATGVTATPRDSSPAPQRNYRSVSLNHLGPNVWEPYEAPSLNVRDAEGKPVTLTSYRGRNVLLIFYLGKECAHCMEQLREVAKRQDEFAHLDTVVLAVSSNQPAENAQSLQQKGDLPFPLLSDSGFENARRFKSYDDFEVMELHSTILIDKKGRVHWARSGGDPFTDFAFLTKQLQRMNDSVKGQEITPVAAQ